MLYNIYLLYHISIFKDITAIITMNIPDNSTEIIQKGNVFIDSLLSFAQNNQTINASKEYITYVGGGTSWLKDYMDSVIRPFTDPFSTGLSTILVVLFFAALGKFLSWGAILLSVLTGFFIYLITAPTLGQYSIYSTTIYIAISSLFFHHYAPHSIKKVVAITILGLVLIFGFWAILS